MFQIQPNRHTRALICRNHDVYINFKTLVAALGQSGLSNIKTGSDGCYAKRLATGVSVTGFGDDHKWMPRVTVDVAR